MQQEVLVVEKELLEVIVEHLRASKIHVDEASQLARDFLVLLPFQDKKDLLNKLKELGAKYDEAQEVYVQELGKESNEKRDDVLVKMRDAIKSGNINHAVAAAKSLQQQNI